LFSLKGQFNLNGGANTRAESRSTTIAKREMKTKENKMKRNEKCRKILINSRIAAGMFEEAICQASMQ